MEHLNGSGDGRRSISHASACGDAARRPTERLDGSGDGRRSNISHVSITPIPQLRNMPPPSESVGHHSTEEPQGTRTSGSTIQPRPCGSSQASQLPNPAQGLDMGAGTNSSATRTISERAVEKARSISRTQKAARSKKRKELTMAMTDDASSPVNAREVQMESHSSTPLVEVSQVVQKRRRRRRRKRASTSEVWQHFHEPAKEPNVASIATCKYCGKEYTWVPENGTGTLWQHLKHRCPEAPLMDVEEPRREHGTPKNSFNYEDCRRELVEMIITDEMPFKTVEKKGFIKYSRRLEPRFHLPSRFTVARDVMDIFNDEKAKLKKVLKNQRICLTTDTWTSIQNLNYMSLTAHWIDDEWQTQRRVLNFCLVADHRGDTLGAKIEECLLEWGIDSIFTITVDNASSNNGAIRHMKRVSASWDGTILKHEFIHMRCCAHIVNLIVKTGIEETIDSVDSIRTAVRFVRSSPFRLDAFKKYAEKEKIACKRSLKLDVDTRWNSMYFMLDIAQNFEKAFARLSAEHKQFKLYFEHKLPPDEIDWQNARCLVCFLKLFYHVTLRLSASLHVTASVFFHEFVVMRSKLAQLCQHRDTTVAGMAGRMLAKFSKYWEDTTSLNFLLFIGIVLDPRYKLKYLKFIFLELYGQDKTKELVERVDVDLRRLFNVFVESAANSASNRHKSQAPLIFDLDEHENDPANLLASQFEIYLEEVETMESNSELARYLAENCEKRTDPLDVLNWWKVNTNKYPILSMLAKNVLAVPFSTVYSESTFSTGGRILNKQRSSLSHSMVEALVCTKSWLNSPSGEVDIKSIVEEAEEDDELEEELSAQASVDNHDLHDLGV